MSRTTFIIAMGLAALVALIAATEALSWVIGAAVSAICPRSEGCFVLAMVGTNYARAALFVAWMLIMGIAFLLRLPQAGFSRIWALAAIGLAVPSFAAILNASVLSGPNYPSQFVLQATAPLAFLIGLAAYFVWFAPAPGMIGGTRGNRLAWGAVALAVVVLIWRNLNIFPDMLNLIPGGWEIAMPLMRGSHGLMAPIDALNRMLPVSIEVVSLAVMAAAFVAIMVPNGPAAPDSGRA